MVKTIKTTGFVFFILFAFSLFISKAPINIGISILLLLAFVELFLNKRYADLILNKAVLAILIPLAVGFMLSFYSTAGVKGSLFFLSRYRFLFLIIPFVLFVTRRKQADMILMTVIISGSMAAIYGFVHGYITSSKFDFNGLLIIKRNSDLFASLGLLNTVFLFECNPENTVRRIWMKAGLLVSLILCVGAIVFIRQRAAMLGLYVGWVVYALFFNKRFLLFVVGLTLMIALSLNSGNPVMTRIKSIWDFEQASNATRIDLYSSGMPYVLERHMLVGTGSKKDSKDFLEFYEKKDNSFKIKNKFAKSHSGNFHNSFLQMAVEGGFLFVLIFLIGLIYLIYRMILELREKEKRLYCMTALVVSIGAFVMFFFHDELYRYGGIIFYLTLIIGCFPYNKDLKGVSREKYNTIPVGKTSGIGNNTFLNQHMTI